MVWWQLLRPGKGTGLPPSEALRPEMQPGDDQDKSSDSTGTQDDLKLSQTVHHANDQEAAPVMPPKLEAQAPRDFDRTTPTMPTAVAIAPQPGLAASYAIGGAFDELMDADAAVRPHWAALLAGLDGLTHQERLDRIDRINMRVRETGIAHDLFADPSSTSQPWRLDLVPLIFSPQGWAQIDKAVSQRARLLEALLDDIYGSQATLRDGHLPPQLIFSDPNYLRACQNITPTSGRIQFFAVDLARNADGTWSVVDTHVETPAGIGYALANRTVSTHVSGDLFKASKAVRLAPFFQQLQDSLAQRINRPDASIALLTPGPRHDDFFSHSFLARYLGFLIVEGEDLRVTEDRVFLKTLAGLQQIDLIVRCVTGSATDSLELDPAGFLGPVGLVQAVRCKPDLLVNALGTAIAENRGLGGYLPALCEHLLGEKLLMWDVKKWWLGDDKARAAVLENLDRYFIRRTWEQTSRPGTAAAARDPAALSPQDRAALIEEIELKGATLVAEEKSALGTAPSYGPEGLEAKPYVVRVFATAVPGGFSVMPGGLAMTVEPGASMALTAPDGASRDVWVQSDAPRATYKSLRPSLETAQIQRAPRDLPSRAADNLFWLGRYIENADWTFRVLRNTLSRLEADSGVQQSLPLMRLALNDVLDRDGHAPVKIPVGLDPPQTVAFLARTLVTAGNRPNGLPQTLDHVHRIASLTRDRLSLEAWRTLNAFYVGRRWQTSALPTSIGESLDLIDEGLRVIAAFNGLSHENMTRNFGWSFLDMGRRTSRALNISRFLSTAFTMGAPGDDDAPNLLFALELADSFITYRSRYRIDPILPLVLDLLIADETNPRSLAYQLAALSNHIDTLPHPDSGHERSECQRIALSLLNGVRLVEIKALAKPNPDGFRPDLAALMQLQTDGFATLSDVLTRRYFSVIETQPRWARARTRGAP